MLRAEFRHSCTAAQQGMQIHVCHRQNQRANLIATLVAFHELDEVEDVVLFRKILELIDFRIHVLFSGGVIRRDHFSCVDLAWIP